VDEVAVPVRIDEHPESGKGQNQNHNDDHTNKNPESSHIRVIRVIRGPYQNENFIASCMILGSCAVRIWPNCGLLRAVTTRAAPGPARKLLVRLNASTRSSMACFSLTRKMRDNAEST